MTSTKDSRPKDWGIIAQFAPDDWPLLQYMARRIRETHDTDMIERLHSACESGSDLVLDNGKALAIVSARMSEDLVLNGGLDQCIKLIQGTSAVKWSYMGWMSAVGGSIPAITDTILPDGDALPPIALSANGWSEARGMKLFFGTITQSLVSDVHNVELTGNNVGNQISEIGIYNKIPPSTSALLNREKFSYNTLNRSVSLDGLLYKNPFILSCVIEFCPVA